MCIRNYRVCDRDNKAISTSSDAHDVAGPGLPVSKRLSKCGNVDAQAALIDGRVWPRSRDQFPLADYVPCALHEGDENIKRSAAHRNREPFLL